MLEAACGREQSVSVMTHYLDDIWSVLFPQACTDDNDVKNRHEVLRCFHVTGNECSYLDVCSKLTTFSLRSSGPTRVLSSAEGADRHGASKTGRCVGTTAFD